MSKFSLHSDLQIAPSAVERDIGRTCAAVLFNVDGVGPDAFLSEVVDVYARLRQVPLIQIVFFHHSARFRCLLLFFPL